MERSIVLELERKLGGCETVEAVIALMRDAQTQQSLAALPHDVVEQVREYAKARMATLGWSSRTRPGNIPRERTARSEVVGQPKVGFGHFRHG
jgi:hypothetical protein